LLIGILFALSSRVIPNLAKSFSKSGVNTLFLFDKTGDTVPGLSVPEPFVGRASGGLSRDGVIIFSFLEAVGKA
jgi:hypothetical protein